MAKKLEENKLAEWKLGPWNSYKTATHDLRTFTFCSYWKDN